MQLDDGASKNAVSVLSISVAEDEVEAKAARFERIVVRRTWSAPSPMMGLPF